MNTGPTFSMLDFIATKKYGGVHTPESIDAFLAALIDTASPLPDYQVASWLMAVCWRDLNFDETAALTKSMAEHGRTCDWSDVGVVVDKHSTGGVGDKTTIALAPLVASLGIPVAKFSGRALGFTGGTLDKLEAIPCFEVNLTPAQMRSILTNCGLVIAGQTADMVPADKALYALRDVTVTVDNIALIAASIMSKKIAGGANGIVLDVKFGTGAFMQRYEDARLLAETMVAIGERTGRVVRAVLSSMEQPLGSAIGNALEVGEAIETLQGQGPADFEELICKLAWEMVQVYLACGGTNPDGVAGMSLDELTPATIAAHLQAGHAHAIFRKWVSLQGGDPRVADHPWEFLAKAPVIVPCPALTAGYVGAFATKDIGELVRGMGGGRRTKTDVLDPAVGLVMHARLGQAIEAGQTLADVHAQSDEQASRVIADLQRLIRIDAIAPELVPPLVAEVLTGTAVA